MLEDSTPRPFRLIVQDDLVRSRPTVFFRLLLAIPVWIALAFWSLAAFVVVVAAWFVMLVRGRCSAGLHEFLAAYVRYSVQVSAYLHLTANPYPGFSPKSDYPVRVEIDGPTAQRRWTVFFRIFLALPTILLAAATGGGGGISLPRGRGAYGATLSGSGIGGVVAVLGWFASVLRGRMPRGLRDLSAYGIGYSAQTYAYVFLLTDRYPSTDPRLAGPQLLPEHPVRIAVTDDLERPRLLVAFRLLLALPHFVWLALWTVAVVPTVLVAWLVALVLARVPTPLHAFLSAYVRYTAHVSAFVGLVGGPFPGFVGAAGSYPIDVTIDLTASQRRRGVLFRGFLAVPAFFIAAAYGGVSNTAAFLGWWYALVRGRMPEGLRNIGASAIRYQSQTLAYVLLLTSRYPYAAPALEGPPEQFALEPGA